MQSLEANGIPVGFSTQQGWLNQEIRTQQLARQLIILGSLQIVFGTLCLVLQAASLAIMLTTYLDSLAFVGYGFWIGAMFIITGPFGIMGGKRKGRCYVTSFNVLSIISACLSGVLLGLAITSALMYDYSDYYYYSESTEQNAGIAMESLMAVTAVAEVIVAIYSSVVCCKMGNCCGECGGDDCCCPPSSYPNQAFVVNQPVIGQFATGQTQQPPMYNGYNQPQPVVLANQQQQPMTYTLPNGQQLVIFQNAPQPMGEISSDQANLTKY